SIFVFVNGRLIRDRLVQHALTDAYRNILPPTVFPVVLLFLEMPPAEVDVNVHPSKIEVRFRQQTVLHDFVRDSVRAALMKARPAPQFTTEIGAHPTASQALSPGARAPWRHNGGLGSHIGSPQDASAGELGVSEADAAFVLSASAPAIPGRFDFSAEPLSVHANGAVAVPQFGASGANHKLGTAVPDHGCAPPLDVPGESAGDSASDLRAL